MVSRTASGPSRSALYRTGAGSDSRADAGRLLLRVALGVLILLHGVAKIGSGPGAIVNMVSGAGLPGTLGYLVYVGEVLAPLLVIVGIWTRPAALVIAINMVVAVLLAHVPQLFTITKMGGWALELQGMFLATAVAIALLGAGRFSLGGAGGRWN